MQDDYCPMKTSDKKCGIVSSDFINALGVNVPKTLPISDVVKLINFSNTVFYNKGARNTFAIDVSNTGSWVRVHVTNDADVERLLDHLHCE